MNESFDATFVAEVWTSEVIELGLLGLRTSLINISEADKQTLGSHDIYPAGWLLFTNARHCLGEAMLLVDGSSVDHLRILLVWLLLFRAIQFNVVRNVALSVHWI